MPYIGPIDVLAAFALAVRRFGLWRALFGAIVVAVGIQPLLPPVPCTCLGPLLRRCDYSRLPMAHMRSDLKFVRSEQEIRRAEHGAFSTDPTDFDLPFADGVTVITVATGDAYMAWTRHRDLDPARGCAVYGGEVPPELSRDGRAWAAALEGIPPGQIVCR